MDRQSGILSSSGTKRQLASLTLIPLVLKVKPKNVKIKPLFWLVAAHTKAIIFSVLIHRWSTGVLSEHIGYLKRSHRHWNMISFPTLRSHQRAFSLCAAFKFHNESSALGKHDAFLVLFISCEEEKHAPGHSPSPKPIDSWQNVMLQRAANVPTAEICNKRGWLVEALRLMASTIALCSKYVVCHIACLLNLSMPPLFGLN